MRTFAQVSRVVALVAVGVLLVGAVVQAEDAAPGRRVRISLKFMTAQSEEAKALGMMWPGAGPSIMVGQFNVLLQTMRTDGGAQVINEPSITTLEDQPAVVNFTTETSHPTSTVSYNEQGQATTTHHIEIVTIGNRAAITPHLRADGSVVLGMSFGPDMPPATGPGAPKDLKLQVTVKPGETVALGGILDTCPGSLVGEPAADQPKWTTFVLVTPQIVANPPAG